MLIYQSSVGYMALPIILNNMHLENNAFLNGKPESERNSLRVCSDVLDILRPQYSGTELVLSHINSTIVCAKSEIFHLQDIEVIGPSTSTGLHILPRVEADDWLCAFLLEPRQFLRIALMLDICLSTGHYARPEELPSHLLVRDSNRSLSALLRYPEPDARIGDSLEPEVVNVEHETGNAPIEATRWKYLDYFGEGGMSVVTANENDNADWNWAMVEKILQEYYA